MVLVLYAKVYWESPGWLAQHEIVRCPTQASSGHQCKMKATCWCYCGRLSTGVTWAVLSQGGPCAPCLPTVSTDLLFTSRGQFMDTRDRQLWLCQSQQVFLLFGVFCLFVLREGCCCCCCCCCCCFLNSGYSKQQQKQSSVQFSSGWYLCARKSPCSFRIRSEKPITMRISRNKEEEAEAASTLQSPLEGNRHEGVSPVLSTGMAFLKHQQNGKQQSVSRV